MSARRRYNGSRRAFQLAAWTATTWWCHGDNGNNTALKLPFELLNPSGLWLLGALVPLVVLYILKVRRERLVVASTWLWAAAQRDLLARHPFQRFTAQVPFLLQALILVLLAFALARPACRSERIVGDHIAIVIDTSASMSALDASGKTRLQLAKEAATSLVDTLGPATDALVLDAGREPRTASPLERDRRRLKAAIAVIEAGQVQGDLGLAISLAVDSLRGLGGSSRLVVFTDGALANPLSVATVGLPTQLIKVGSPVDNAAIVRFDVRAQRDPSGGDTVKAFAMLANFGSHPRDLFVTLAQTGASDVLASRKVLLQPGERAPVELSFAATPGDVGQGLVLQLSPPDAMTADDVAYGKVPPGDRISVVLATSSKSSPWLERALLADPQVELLRTGSSNLESTAIPDGALVVVDGVCPQRLPLGEVLIVNPGPGRCLTAMVGDPIEAPLVTSWATADDRFRFLTLDGLMVAKARVIDVESERERLIRTSHGTIAADVSTPGRSATLVGFDVGETNWPYKASFVLFVRNLVERARSRRARGVETATAAGEPVRVAVPAGLDHVEVQYPNEQVRNIKARDGLAIVPDTSMAGIYHVSWKGTQPGSVVFAVSLASEAESNLSGRSAGPANPSDRPDPDMPAGLAGTAGPKQAAKQSAEQAAKQAAGQSAEQAGNVTVSSEIMAHTEWTGWLGLLAFCIVLADVWYLTRRPGIRAFAREPLRPKLPERPVRSAPR